MSDPAYPPGVRPFRAGDEVPILAAMLAAHGRGEFEGVNRHWLEESVRRLAEEPEGCAVAEEDGRVAGWISPHDDELTVDLPYRRRGHGRRLVAAGRVVAARMGLPYLRLWVPRRAGPEAFARSVGLRYRSSLWLMRLPDTMPVDRPAFPADVVVRPLIPGVDEPAFAKLVNAAFLDHPSPLRIEPDRLRRVHARPDFDPTTILLVAPVDDPGRLVAFCRVRRYAEDDGRPVGEVALVGVLPELRGRGLGRELVRWGVTDVRRRGAGDVFLSVEGENEGALRLYESLGFARHVEWPHWVLPAAPGATPTP